MEATCSNLIVMPAHCAILTEEEMVYLEGGALSITKQDVINFGINFANNAVLVIGSMSFSMGTEYFFNQIGSYGWSLGMNRMWNRLTGFNGWQVAALIGCSACAAYYVTGQVLQIVAMVVSLGSVIKQAIDQTVEQAQQGQVAAVA